MTDEQIIFTLFLAVGATLIGVGIPLWKERIRPNHWYGFRTPATLRDERLWYPVNRLCGIWCVLTGAATAVMAICTFVGGLNKDAAAGVNAGVMGALLLVMVVHCFVALARCKRSLEEAAANDG